MIRIKVKEALIIDYNHFEHFNALLRTSEDRIRHEIELEPFLNEIALTLPDLGFKHMYFFLYAAPGEYAHNFRMILSCTDGRRALPENEKCHFPDFQSIVSALLSAHMPFNYFILPVAYCDTKYGFLILNMSADITARVAYDTLISLLGSTLKSIRLLDELKDANRQLEISHKKLETAQYNLNREMQAAHTIQTALLPRDLSHAEFDIAARMITAIAVGGDYYDFIRDGKRDWIVIGDVSGHGVHAGLIMMMAQTSLHVLLRENPGLSPVELLSRINAVIADNIKRLGDPKYMTILVLCHQGQGRFVFSGMHLPLLIYRKQSRQVEKIQTNGFWLGMLDDITGLNREDSFVLESGDCLLLYTDGLTEAESTDNASTMYGDEHLKEFFCAHGDEPAGAIADKIMADLESYRLLDDVTLFVVKRL